MQKRSLNEMEMDEIKKKKLEAMMRQQQDNIQGQMQEEAKLKQQIQELEAVVKLAMTKDALARYGNMKSAHPEKSVQLLVVLGQLMQQGQLGQITDEILKKILLKLTPEKKETKIRRI